MDLCNLRFYDSFMRLHWITETICLDKQSKLPIFASSLVPHRVHDNVHSEAIYHISHFQFSKIGETLRKVVLATFQKAAALFLRYINNPTESITSTSRCRWKKQYFSVNGFGFTSGPNEVTYAKQCLQLHSFSETIPVLDDQNLAIH